MVPVVICCADADAATIRPVADEFEGRGHDVVLLDGVRDAPEQLALTVAKYDGEGLYVLCRSKALGRSAVDELRDILLAHHVPFGRTLTVASTRPRELRDRIEASLRRIATSKTRPTGGEPQTRRRTRLGLATPPPPPPDANVSTEFDQEEAATGVRLDPMRSTKMGMPTVQPAQPPPPPEPVPNRNAEDSVGPDAELPDPGSVEPAARLTPAIETDPTPVPAEAPDLIDASELADLDADAADNATPPVRTGNTTVAPAIPRSRLDAVRTGHTAIVDHDTLVSSGIRPEDPEPPPAGLTQRSPAVTAPSDLAPVPPSTRRWAWVGLGAAALTLVVVVSVALRDDDTSTEDDVVADADTPDTEPEIIEDRSDEDRSDAPEATSASDEPPEPVTDGPTRIGHALRSREIRALDVLLVSNTTGPLPWDAAKAHCDGLDLGGLQAWRLPEVGELRSLTDASMTQRGYYWTGTPADTFGDTPLVWYSQRERIVTRARDSLVMCVRGGNGAG